MMITKSFATLASMLLVAPLAMGQKAYDPPARGPGDGGTCPPGDTTLCIPLDGSFSVPSMDAGGGSGQATPGDPCQRNDDDSTLAIPLQFSFDLFGTLITDVNINNNGNISFGGPFATFTASGFPVAGFPMVAPFWGDVDTGNVNNNGGGVVYYRSEANRFTVIWDHVGYYNEHFDLQSTFELIITDGTDALIGIGNNICFCYDDMQWTTGDASGGSGGFGGTAATVGVNAGDGVNYFQIGRFDHAGLDYDGPGGSNDGVSYLDNRTICFSVAENPPENVPPVVVGAPPGNKVTLEVGETGNFLVEMISPEIGQTTTITVDSGGLANFSCNLTPGNPATAACTFTPSLAQVGAHAVIFTGTDDDPVNPLSTVLTIELNVEEPPECFLVVGDGTDDDTFFPGIHSWSTSVGSIGEYHAVLMEDIPTFLLPATRASLGGATALKPAGGQVSMDPPLTWSMGHEFSVQIVMWNPIVFPQLPEQWSQSLHVVVLPDGNVLTRPFGDTTGIQVWAETGADALGRPTIRFPFLIPGL